MSEVNKYNSWCKWHPLKTVMLGRSFYPEYYRDVKNLKVKDCLLRIADETEEDFQNYKTVLGDFGCDVLRPELSRDSNLMDDIANNNVPRPPAQPRDGQLVIDDGLIYTMSDHPSIKTKLDEYNSVDVRDYTDSPITENTYNQFAGADWPSYQNYKAEEYDGIPNEIIAEIKSLALNATFNFAAPCMTNVGNRMYMDSKEISPELHDVIHRDYPNREIIKVDIGGHTDGCFHTLKEGAIISLKRYENYAETFPGWDVCYLENQSWTLVSDFMDLKQRNGGKWWLAGEEKNNDFTDFVETWLTDWVGYCEESVFDVNVLMLDDKHVCVNNYNETAFKYFKKHNIEPIIVPFRHRYFWDGGLHCITLDLYREGECEDYFKKA